jgi:hypothetical protein
MFGVPASPERRFVTATPLNGAIHRRRYRPLLIRETSAWSHGSLGRPMCLNKGGAPADWIDIPTHTERASALLRTWRALTIREVASGTHYQQHGATKFDATSNHSVAHRPSAVIRGNGELSPHRSFAM